MRLPAALVFPSSCPQQPSPPRSTDFGVLPPLRGSQPFLPHPHLTDPFQGGAKRPQTSRQQLFMGTSSTWTGVCTPMSPQEPFSSRFLGYLLDKMVQDEHQSILLYVAAALLAFSLSSFFPSHKKRTQKYVFALFYTLKNLNHAGERWREVRGGLAAASQEKKRSNLRVVLLPGGIWKPKAAKIAPRRWKRKELLLGGCKF